MSPSENLRWRYCICLYIVWEELGFLVCGVLGVFSDGWRLESSWLENLQQWVSRVCAAVAFPLCQQTFYFCTSACLILTAVSELQLLAVVSASDSQCQCGCDRWVSRAMLRWHHTVILQADMWHTCTQWVTHTGRDTDRPTISCCTEASETLWIWLLP